MARKPNGPIYVAPVELVEPASEPTGNAGQTSSAASGDGNNGGAGDGSITIDPASVGNARGDGNDDNAGDGQSRKRRGRKPGSANKSKAAVPRDIDAIEALLLSVHSLLALRVEELALDKAEARALAEGYSNVARHYPLLAKSEKVIDWGNLLMALSIVYGPRAVAIRNRLSAAPKPQAVPRPAGNAAANGVGAPSHIPGVGTVVIPPGAIP
jgi:hypothetical protein